LTPFVLVLDFFVFGGFLSPMGHRLLSRQGDPTPELERWLQVPPGKLRQQPYRMIKERAAALSLRLRFYSLRIPLWGFSLYFVPNARVGVRAADNRSATLARQAVAAGRELTVPREEESKASAAHRLPPSSSTWRLPLTGDG
jgi:hypothetical protein